MVPWGSVRQWHSRVVAIAMVRDRFEGEQMARTMSFILAIFILVPVVAPSIGAAIVAVLPVEWVFVVPAVAAAAMALWARRLPETLRPEHRLELRFARIRLAARFVVTDRQTVGYTLALTALFAVFTSYLASSEIIITEVFGLGERFPLVFGGLAAVMGLGMLASGVLVDRVGTRRLGRATLVGYVVSAGFVGGLAVVTGGVPPFWVFAVGLAVLLGFHAVLIPNFNTLAMEAMAAVAGTASALIGAFSTAVGSLLGAVLDRTFDGTVLPLSIAFLGFGVLAAFAVGGAPRGNANRPAQGAGGATTTPRPRWERPGMTTGPVEAPGSPPVWAR
jgi:DHA1 family bicyclomycin/chloramphenicol resistance-like MFS transporter